MATADPARSSLDEVLRAATRDELIQHVLLQRDLIKNLYGKIVELEQELENRPQPAKLSVNTAPLAERLEFPAAPNDERLDKSRSHSTTRMLDDNCCGQSDSSNAHRIDGAGEDEEHSPPLLAILQEQLASVEQAISDAAQDEDFSVELMGQLAATAEQLRIAIANYAPPSVALPHRGTSHSSNHIHAHDDTGFVTSRGDSVAGRSVGGSSGIGGGAAQRPFAFDRQMRGISTGTSVRDRPTVEDVAYFASGGHHHQHQHQGNSYGASIDPTLGHSRPSSRGGTPLNVASPVSSVQAAYPVFPPYEVERRGAPVAPSSGHLRPRQLFTAPALRDAAALPSERRSEATPTRGRSQTARSPRAAGHGDGDRSPVTPRARNELATSETQSKAPLSLLHRLQHGGLVSSAGDTPTRSAGYSASPSSRGRPASHSTSPAAARIGAYRRQRVGQ